jgi:hypothetical protein
MAALWRAARGNRGTIPMLVGLLIVSVLAYELGRRSVRVTAAQIAAAEHARAGLSGCASCEVL